MAKIGYRGVTTLAEISRPVVRYGLDIAVGAAKTAKYEASYTAVDVAMKYPGREGWSFLLIALKI